MKSNLRQKLVETAKSFVGLNEVDGSHRKIIDIYNAYTPLPVGYKVKYTDDWCATFASAVAMECGLTEIIPPECSCYRQVNLWQKMNRWEEDDAYTPQPGDYIYYNWSDGANFAQTDNKNVPNHVGIVYQVTGRVLVIIEGNYQNKVTYRTINVNARYIRGYGLPDYEGYELKQKEELTKMEYIAKPTRMEIFVNDSKLTTAQIQSKTGCDAIINAGLYDMTKWKAVMQLKANGKIFANEPWANYGFGWNKDISTLTMAPYMNSFENFIACVCLVRNFVAVGLQYNAAMGGARQRTALGLMDDGNVWIFLTKTATTPEALQKLAIDAGCKYAIMLDGGASTQGITPVGKITSPSRPAVQNYILFWFDKTVDPTKCPYAEPTANIRKGSFGEGVKWLQWYLNQFTSKLDIDGQFGQATHDALVHYQQKHGLTVDGICGANTRKNLKNALKAKDSLSNSPKECPYPEPTRLIYQGCKGEDVKWVQWHLNHHGKKLDEDGIFGAKSREALCEFQYFNNLTVDGECGPLSRKKLKEDLL